METLNEKQIILKREITEMQEVALQNHNRRRNELIMLKTETGYVFEQEKKRLQTQLNELLSDRLKMRADGIANTHAEMRKSFENEKRIHELQSANRVAFFEKLRDIARKQDENSEEYRAEKLKISNYKAEMLLQFERERKELLSLNDEKEKG